MNSQDAAPTRRATESTNQPGAMSRRRLLASGAAVAAIATLPTRASGDSPAAAPARGAARQVLLTKEHRRLAAVLERHGPEFGRRR